MLCIVVSHGSCLESILHMCAFIKEAHQWYKVQLSITIPPNTAAMETENTSFTSPNETMRHAPPPQGTQDTESDRIPLASKGEENEVDQNRQEENDSPSATHEAVLDAEGDASLAVPVGDSSRAPSAEEGGREMWEEDPVKRPREDPLDTVWDSTLHKVEEKSSSDSQDSMDSVELSQTVPPLGPNPTKPDADVDVKGSALSATLAPVETPLVSVVATPTPTGERTEEKEPAEIERIPENMRTDHSNGNPTEEEENNDKSRPLSPSPGMSAPVEPSQLPVGNGDTREEVREWEGAGEEGVTVDKQGSIDSPQNIAQDTASVPPTANTASTAVTPPPLDQEIDSGMDPLSIDSPPTLAPLPANEVDLGVTFQPISTLLNNHDAADGDATPSPLPPAEIVSATTETGTPTPSPAIPEPPSTGHSSSFTSNITGATSTIMSTLTQCTPSSSPLPPGGAVNGNGHSGIVANGNGLNLSSGLGSQQPKEKSVFVRLSNRIRDLEENMTLFSSYLDQISTRCSTNSILFV